MVKCGEVWVKCQESLFTAINIYLLMSYKELVKCEEFLRKFVRAEQKSFEKCEDWLESP